jgi:hypothetical protein
MQEEGRRELQIKFIDHLEHEFGFCWFLFEALLCFGESCSNNPAKGTTWNGPEKRVILFASFQILTFRVKLWGSGASEKGLTVDLGSMTRKAN